MFQVHSTHWEDCRLPFWKAWDRLSRWWPRRSTEFPNWSPMGVTGWLYPHADADALTSRLLDAAEHPEQRRRMGLEGRKVVQHTFSQEMFASNLMELYARVLGRPKIKEREARLR